MQSGGGALCQRAAGLRSDSAWVPLYDKSVMGLRVLSASQRWHGLARAGNFVK